MDHWFLDRLVSFGDDVAFRGDGETVSYRQLGDCVVRWQDRLSATGIVAGDRVAFDGDFSTERCSLLLALLAGGQTAVPLPAFAPQPLEVACVTAAITRNSEGDWECRRISTQRSHPPLERLRAQNEPGLVLFSSGSTGQLKGAVWNFNRLLDRFRTTRPAPVTLAFLKLDHIGGLNTLFHTLAGGGAAVAATERNPEAICRAIEQHRVELLPTTPTFLKMLLISEAHRRYDLSSLELITYGTEPMPASTLEDLHQALPGVRLKQTYGLTELGILPSKSRNSDSLWLRVGDPTFETKIVNGILWIRARTAMMGYLNAPSPFDEEGWFNTQDVVEVDGEWIRVLGRSSDVINVGGEKVHPAEVENILLQIDNVKEVAVHGRPNPVTGQIVIAHVSVRRPEDPAQVRRRVRDFCKVRLSPHQVPALVEVTEGSLHGDRFKKIRR